MTDSMTDNHNWVSVENIALFKFEYFHAEDAPDAERYKDLYYNNK